MDDKPGSSGNVNIGDHATIKGDVVQGGKRVVKTNGGPYLERPTFNVTLIIGSATVGLVLIVVIVLSVVGYSIFPTASPTPTPMPLTTFNLAVAHFSLADAAKGSISPEVSQRLSNILFDAIKSKIRSGQGVLLLGPDQVGVMDGQDPLSRVNSVEKFARSNNITLLIYGLITSDDHAYYLNPDIYIAPSGVKYAPEITGPSQLGRVIAIDRQQLEMQSDQEIAARLNAQYGVEVLQQLILGLVDFYEGEYTRASLKFTLVTDMDPDNEVAFLLLGAAKLRTFGPKIDPAQGRALLISAYEAFYKANTLNPNYPRAYLGLAAVTFSVATQPGVPDETGLAEAEKLYLKSKEFPEHPGSFVAAKADYGLAQIYWARYTPVLPQDQPCPGNAANSNDPAAQQARAYFSAVIKAYERNPTNDLAWFAGHSHASIGWIEGSQNDWAATAREYRTAIEVLKRMAAPPDDYIAYYWSARAEAEQCLKNVDGACLAYEQAVLTAQTVITANRHAFDDQDMANWQAKLEECTRKGPP